MSEPKTILMFDDSPGQYFVATVFLMAMMGASLMIAFVVPYGQPALVTALWAWAVGAGTVLLMYKTRILIQQEHRGTSERKENNEQT